jgi:hypothetical protein
MSEPTTLADDITAAFERACREKDWQIAEFLLQVLEVLCERDQAQSARQLRTQGPSDSDANPSGLGSKWQFY